MNRKKCLCSSMGSSLVIDLDLIERPPTTFLVEKRAIPSASVPEARESQFLWVANNPFRYGYSHCRYVRPSEYGMRQDPQHCIKLIHQYWRRGISADCN
mmetsp:Transcript_33758/g.132681  ORF Transcript_33758/g.132681 Transcript_33758/m.132681 type:complete len:99 (+) Transcript_33758:305-601(+)